MLTHLDNRSSRRKHSGFLARGTAKERSLHQRCWAPYKKKNQSINLVMSGFLFHVSKWKHQCWTLQESMFLLTAAPLQVEHNGRAEAQQPILYQLGCVTITVCSHILPMNKKKNHSEKKNQFLAICFSSAFEWWHGIAIKYSTELFWRHPVCLQCWKKTPTLEHSQQWKILKTRIFY